VTRDGVAATGFLVAGPFDEAGNSSVSASLKARIREEEMEEMIAAVGQTFLGVTVNCARAAARRCACCSCRTFTRRSM
jgi:hypothetical protein